MKLFRFSNSLFYTGAVILLSSCGSGSNEKKAATDSTAATDSAAKAQVVNTIITTPQSMVVVTHKVANYAKWLIAYEEHDSARLASGLHNFVIGRGLEDSNMIMVALKADDTAKAKAFEKSSDLRMRMKKAGVVGVPTIAVNTTTWQDTSNIGSSIRSVATLMVKDWDAFVKAFEDGKKTRADNGIMDRAFGHALDDNKKVFVVTALTDTAKAFAYYKSDELKKRRAAAGVIGEPTRFFFRIAKKY